MYLTRRQREVFDFIRQFIEDNSYSPSLEEIAKGMELSSLATVHKHLSNLATKGIIKRHWNKGRGIEIVSDLGSPNIVQMQLDAAYKLPVKGTVAAGLPIEAYETDSERLAVPSEMVKNADDTFVLRVRGDSMIDDGIHEGDYLIVERVKDARNGQAVVALVNGYETTVKRLYKEGENIRLQPANSTMAPIIVMAKDVEIQGIVVGLIRNYRE
ncbi:MAG TPA: transcriptional repressor LexA [Candidatus Sumerlaeota bacterium]|nr:transcriptional repressor LexA [Candidatus Sumerlaeota bacterium]HNM46989.1 transcriptional repressor LexA [Candidatus Sumerlaeota bacterium]